MGHLATDFGFHWTATGPAQTEKAQETWWHRIGTAVAARLGADTPPLAAAMAYGYAFRAVPLPRD